MFEGIGAPRRLSPSVGIGLIIRSFASEPIWVDYFCGFAVAVEIAKCLLP